MAIQTSSTLRIDMNWLQKDTGTGNNNTQDSAIMSKTTQLSNGSGSGQVNTVWFGSGSLNSGDVEIVDVYSLSRSILGGSLETSFSGGYIKNIVVTNSSTGSDQIISLVNTGANHITEYSNNSGCVLLVQPNTMFTINHPLEGYQIDSSNRYLSLSGHVSGCSYEIGLIGSV